MRLQELSGELISVEEVNRQWEEQAVRIRTKILGLASRLAGVLSGKVYSASEVEGIMTPILREILSELASEISIKEKE